MAHGKRIDHQRMLDIGRRWLDALDDGADSGQFAAAMGIGKTTVMRAAAMYRAHMQQGRQGEIGGQDVQ